jgi:hypothetical protein
MTRDRCQECHYFAHLHLFPNLFWESKHGSREVPRRNDLRTRLGMGKTSYHF